MPSPGDREPTVFVDDRPVPEVPGPQATGAQILAAAGLDPDDVDLYAQGHAGRRIGPEEAVPVQEGGRFVTRPRR